MSLTDSPGGGRKYELVADQQVIAGGGVLYRIRALKDFGNLKAGTLGGFIASERNLSHHGDCWVGDDARVYDEAVVSDDAQVFARAQVYGQARIGDRGQVLGNARVFEHGRVFRSGIVCDNAMVYGRAQVRDHGLVFGNARLCDRVRVLGSGQVCGDTQLQGDTVVGGDHEVRRPLPGAPPRRGRRRPPSPRGPHP